MKPDLKTPMSLLVRAREGDEDAWDRIVKLYGPAIYRQCRGKGLSRDDAEDATQTVFKAIAVGLDSFRKDKPSDKFHHWVQKIASNKIVDHFRSLAKQPVGTGGTTAMLLIQQTPEEFEAEWSTDELRREVYRRAVRLLKSDFEDRTWHAYWEMVVEGRSSEDVGEEFGMKPGTLRQIRYKVKEHLKAEFGDVL